MRQNMISDVFLKIPLKTPFIMHPTNDNEIKKIVGNLECSFSAGVDGLSSSFLKQIIPYISVPFSHICNLSIVNGEFPTAMKISKVIPVHKSGDANTLNNYRPIFLLPSLSKVLERIMYDRLYKYLSANNMIIPEQFGFKKLFNGIGTSSRYRTYLFVY